jgi:hypothetical protein
VSAGATRRSGAGAAGRPRIGYTDHLVGLVAAAEAAASRLAGADPDRRAEVAAASRREQALLSARLDGSPLEDATAAEVDARESAGDALVGTTAPPPEAAARGSWARTLKLDAMGTQEVAAVEYANLLRCHDAEAELAGRFFDEPLEVLRSLHGHICAGLVDPEAIGRFRTTVQAVHDGAQGAVIYNAPDPAGLPGLVEALGHWLGRGSARVPAVVLSAVVHERILEWQPFEAGNGRVARAAARVVLRARGLDPHGVAVPERHLAAQSLTYYREVAATIRRRGDLRPWLERCTEAVLGGLVDAAAAAHPSGAVAAPARALEVMADLVGGESLSLSEYAGRAGVSLDVAHQDLRALALAGSVRMEPGTSGLRYRRT